MRNTISVRAEVRHTSYMLNRFKHNYRTVKIKSEVKPNDNIFLRQKSNGKWKMIIDKSIVKGHHKKTFNSKIIRNILEQNENECKRFFEKKHNKYFSQYGHKNRTTGELVVYLGADMRDFDLDIWKNIYPQVINNINNFMNSIGGFPIDNLQIHTGESGMVHCHIFYKNYNKEGKSLRLTNNKEKMVLLQDFIAKGMEEYHLRRGNRNSTTKHLSIRDYKFLMEAQEELMKTMELFEEIIEDILLLGDKPKGEQLLQTALKYIENGKSQKLRKLMTKASEVREAIRKKVKAPKMNNK